MKLNKEMIEVREDKQTSTPDGAAAYERNRAQATGDYQDDTPDPSEYMDPPNMPRRPRGPIHPDVAALDDPWTGDRPGKSRVGMWADHYSGLLDPRRVIRDEGDSIWIDLFGSEVGPCPAKNYRYYD